MRTEGRAPSSDAQQAKEGPTVERPSVADYALLEELRFVRREAQAEANLAYEDWGALPCGERYAVFRAAQDRADAAQDQLADWASEIGPHLTDGALALQPLS
jgi:acyl-CoA reductase-like NAD-dependent aldehyde dehydrogenase